MSDSKEVCRLGGWCRGVRWSLGACAGVASTYVVVGALCAGAGLVGVVAWAARLGAMPICVEDTQC